MENTKMYVITMATGSHDSSSEKVICITPDLKKGEDYVNQKNQAFSSMSEKLNKFHKNEYKEWKLNNPSPQNKVKLLDIPKWKSNQEITPEMREEN